MENIADLLSQTFIQVGTTFLHNWPFLLISVLVSVLLKLYVDPNQVSAFLTRHRGAGVVGATVAAVATPLCSCGTTAIILGMMASMMPWAPIVAFMVASPLTSPEELIYSAGLFGWPFALMFFASSIILGLLGGVVAGVFENRGWLMNQTRFADPAKVGSASVKNGQPVSQPIVEAPCGCSAQPVSLSTAPVLAACGCSGSAEFALELPVITATVKPAQTACGCGDAASPVTDACACESSQATAGKPRVTPRLFLEETLTTGKRLLIMFAGFAFIGYLLNGLIPSEWVAAVFGKGNIYSVPLAATLGLPLYINTEGSLPLVRALIDGGMSQGAAMAFLITGAGTSFGAVAGALTIARWRVIALVIGTLWVGAVVLGYLYNVMLAVGLV